LSKLWLFLYKQHYCRSILFMDLLFRRIQYQDKRCLSCNERFAGCNGWVFL